MRPRTALCALACLCATRDPAAAATAPLIDAQVSTTSLALDESVQLVVTVTRDSTHSLQSYSRPDVRDFDILSQNQADQTQWSMVNGVTTIRTVEQHVYLLHPRRKGTLTIPPASVRVDGRELRTREIVVTVNAPSKRSGGAASPSAGGAPQPIAAPEGMSGAEDVFVEARVENPLVPAEARGEGAPARGTALHVGEQVIVTWRIFSRGEIWHYRMLAEPKHEDFWSEDLYAPPGRLSWQRARVKGQDYLVAVLLRRALFPLRSGKLTISPLTVEATTVQTAFYPGASAERATRALTLEVLPLPAAGRPDGFEPGNVGRFDVTSSVDNAHPRAGEAISLRVVVKGQGNLRNVRLPRLDALEGFKVYDPTSLDAIDRSEAGVSGQKVLTYLLLPRKGGPLTVPAINFPYYDPADSRYAVAVAPAINVTVEGDPEKIGTGPAEAKENVLAPRIKPLRIRSHVETAVGERLLRGRTLLVALLAPPSLLALIVSASAVRARLRRETAGSRRRRARAAARRHLRAGEAHIRGQKPSAFFAECARAIYDHLDYRLGMRCESYTIEELRTLLPERGFAGPLADAVASELLACEFARFAASAPDATEMRAALKRVKQLLDAVERAPLPTASRGTP